jgi:hypothetical protein
MHLCQLQRNLETAGFSIIIHLNDVFVSQLSRKCGSLNISQPYVPPWPVTGIPLPFTSMETRDILIMQQCPSQLPKSKDSWLNTNFYTRTVVLAISDFCMYEHCLSCNAFMVKNCFRHLPAFCVSLQVSLMRILADSSHSNYSPWSMRVSQ